MAEWNPFEDVAHLRREIDRAFEGFDMAQSPPRRVAFLPARGPREYPLINLLEDKDQLYVEALTPGVDPQSLNLTVMNNRLTIGGEKPRMGGKVPAKASHGSGQAGGKLLRRSV